MAKRITIRNETIPNASKILGQSTMTYKTGGAYATSFNSTDLFNFNVKDEGLIEFKDPQKSYLTSTFYPLLFTDSLTMSSQKLDRLTFTDNLYASAGSIEECKTTVKEVSIPLFKQALFVIDYYSNSYTKRDALVMRASRVSINLRDVLKLYSYKGDTCQISTKVVSFSIRSVLIRYDYYKPENIKVGTVVLTKMQDTVFSNNFTSFLSGDSVFVSTTVSDKVSTIKDLAQLTWTIPDTLHITTESKAGNQSLVIDEGAEGFVSNESLGLSTEDGIEVMFENWFKPELSTTSLLTTYGSEEISSEISPLNDKVQGKPDWRNMGTGYTETSVYGLTSTSYLVKDVPSVDTDFLISNPNTGAKGTTVELNCKVTGTDRIILLSNGTTALTALGTSFAVVWYGEESDATIKNKVAIVTDDVNLKDSNNHLIVSQDTFVTGSSLQICIIVYNLYMKLFINGKLQGVKLISKDFNLAAGNKVFIGKSNWYAYKTEHNLEVQSFRFTKMALYLENSYKVQDPFIAKVIPNINRLATNTRYTTGVTCGLRYSDIDNTTRVFASITDAYEATFTVESQPIDPSKWNYVQLANTGSELTLFINGLATKSIKLPYNIRFREVTVSSKDSSNYRGVLDNFRIYSKIKDSSNRLKSSDLYFALGGSKNEALLDSNPDITWTFTANSSIEDDIDNAYRNVKLVGGLTSEDATVLIGDSSFYLAPTVRLKTYKDADTILASNVAVSGVNSYTTPFNLATNALTVRFTIDSLDATKLLSVGSLAIELEAASENLKPYIKINTFRTELPTVFRVSTEYTLTILKIGEQILFFVDNQRVLTLRNTVTVQGSEVTIGSFTGSLHELKSSDVERNSRIFLDNKDRSLGQGLQVLCYEVFENQFLFEASFDSVNRAFTDYLLETSVSEIRIVFDNKSLYFKVNNEDSEPLTSVTFNKGSTTLAILSDSQDKRTTVPFDLLHFESSATKQDALLTTTFDITKVENETIFKNAVLALSSDSDYRNSVVFDRNSNVPAKDIFNSNGVSKAVKEVGYYFNGTSYLQIEPHNDFVFGTDPFYIEFELKTNISTRRQVILDRYIQGVGSWQVSVNLDGHLMFSITNSTTTPYATVVDIPTKLNDSKWHKVQIDRFEKIFKFYVDGQEVYEYSTETLFNFNATGMSLFIGHQGTIRSLENNYQGYLNNIRIVKGLSLSSDLGAGTSEELLEATKKVSEGIDNPAVVDAIESFAKGLPYTIDMSAKLVSIEGTMTYLWRNVSDGGLPYDISTTYADNLTEACGLFVEGLDYVTNYDYRLNGTTPSETGGVCHIGIYQAGTNYLVNSNNTTLSNEQEVQRPDVLVTFTELAQVILDNARLGNAIAKEFLGLSRNNVEDYSIYKTTSSTVFALSSVTGTIYDSKRNVWAAAAVNSVEGPAPNNLEWLEVGEYLESTEAVLKFTANSDFTIEASIAVIGTQSTERVIIQSLNSSTNAVLFTLGVLPSNKGLFFDVLVDEGVERRTVICSLEDSAWYKIALCQINGRLYFYINNLKYACEPISTPWVSAINYKTRILAKGMKIEVFKVSNECVYFINKTKEYQFLSHSLNFENNNLDSGNEPVEWVVEGTEPALVSPLYQSGSIQVTADSRITANNVLNSATSPFSIDLTLKFSNTQEETILEINTEAFNFRLFKSTDKQIRVSTVVNEEELISIFNNVTINTLDWYRITLSRDYGGVLTLSVNGVNAYAGGFNYDVINSEFKLGGFTGYIYNLKVFNNYVYEHKYGENVLKLDFEKTSVGDAYVLEKAKERLLRNYNTTVIKGLSKTSDNVLYFDGVSSYIETPRIGWLNFEKDYFEITFSMYPSNGQNKYQTLLSAGASTFSQDTPFIMLYGNSQPSHLTQPASNRIAVGLGATLEDNPILLSNSQIVYNTWTHVRLVKKDDTLSLYLNGILDTTITTEKMFNFMSYDKAYVGRNAWDGAEGYFQGYLDDFKISRFTGYKEVTTITATEGLLSAIDFEDVGTSFDIVESSLTNSLDSYGNAWTTAVYNNQVSLQPPVFKTVSAINDAIFFEGSGYMYCYNKHFAVGLDQFTISFEVCQTKRNGDSYIFDQTNLYNAYINSSGILYLNIGSQSFNLGLVNLERWYTVSATRDENYTLRVFVDGKLKQTVANFKTNFNYGDSTIYPMCLGTDWDVRDHPSYRSRYLIGYIDNFLFERNRCRYKADHTVYADKFERRVNTSLFEYVTPNQTSFTDLANPQLTWSSSGISTVTDTAYTTYAGRSTSTSAYAVSSAHSWELGHQDFTIDLLFKPQQILADSCLLDMSVSTSTAEGIQIVQPVGNTSSISVRLSPAGSQEWFVELNTGINTISTNKVYHLRVCRNLGTIYLYLDGVLKASRDYTTNVTIGGTVTLFNNKGRTRGFTGTIEQFRFIKEHALSAVGSFKEIKESFK